MHRIVISRLIHFNALLTLFLTIDAGAVGWKEQAPMPDPRQEVAVAELDGMVYVIGGFRPSAQVSDSVEVYDPVSDTWSIAAPFPVPVHHAAAIAVSGRLYVVGGCTTSFVPLSTLYEYDAVDDSWIQRASMPAPRCSMAVAEIGGKIYVAGGSPPVRERDFTVYDPVLDQWTILNKMPTGRNHLAAGAAGGNFYAIGGRNDGIGGVEFVTEEYDPATALWTTKAPMPTARGGVAYATLGNNILVFGGEGNPQNPLGVFEQVEVYDTVMDKWMTLPPMPTPRHGIAAAVVDQLIYIPGGASTQGLGVSDRHEVFDANAISDFLGVFCEVSVDQESYGLGEEVWASRFRIANLAEHPVTVELKSWYELPLSGISKQVLSMGAAGFLTVRPGVDIDVAPFSLFLVMNDSEAGVYRFGCRTMNQVTGRESTYVEDVFDVNKP